MKIKHKFKDHKISNETKILIIGTFNPKINEKNNPATFFYGRPHNFLWKLLPEVFGEENLKKKDDNAKFDFMNKYKIDFIDLISEIEDFEVENTKDRFSDVKLDKKNLKWNTDKIIHLIKNKLIQEVYFTRKTFQNIENIRNEIEKIERYCKNNNKKFEYLETPARPGNEQKLKNWRNAFEKNLVRLPS